MIEINLYCSVAPIPFARITNRVCGNIVTNYLWSLISLAFKSIFIMVIDGIYLILVPLCNRLSSTNAKMPSEYC